VAFGIKRFDNRVTRTARDLNPRKGRVLIALLHLLIRAYAIFIFATTAERRSCVEWKTENPHPLDECGTANHRRKFAPGFTSRFIAIIREGEKSADERTEAFSAIDWHMVTRSWLATKRAFFFRLDVPSRYPLADRNRSALMCFDARDEERFMDAEDAQISLSRITQLPRPRRVVTRVIPSRASEQAGERRECWSGCWIGCGEFYRRHGINFSIGGAERPEFAMRAIICALLYFDDRRARVIRAHCLAATRQKCVHRAERCSCIIMLARASGFSSQLLFGYPCTRVLKLEVRAFAPFSRSEAAVKNRSCYVSLRSFARKFRPANRSLITAR